MFFRNFSHRYSCSWAEDAETQVLRELLVLPKSSLRNRRFQIRVAEALLEAFAKGEDVILHKEPATRMQPIDSCAVCLEPGSKRLAQIRGCGHVFHEDCLRNWMRRSSKCPLCRHDHSQCGVAFSTPLCVHANFAVTNIVQTKRRMICKYLRNSAGNAIASTYHSVIRSLFDPENPKHRLFAPGELYVPGVWTLVVNNNASFCMHLHIMDNSVERATIVALKGELRRRYKPCTVCLVVHELRDTIDGCINPRIYVRDRLESISLHEENTDDIDELPPFMLGFADIL